MTWPTPLLVYPEALALAIPAAVLWWFLARCRSAGTGSWLRAVFLAALVLAAAQPELAWQRGGSDVVVIVDQSQSMPGPEREAQAELISLIGEQRGKGDRLAVIAMADGQAVLQAPASAGVPHLSGQPVPGSASDLAGALQATRALLAPGRSGRVIIHSDGEYTGRDPRSLAAGLALSRVPIDSVVVQRLGVSDAALLHIELPDALRLGESFIGAIQLWSDRSEQRSWSVYRGEHQVASGSASLRAGVPLTIPFADRPTAAGLIRYRVELETTDDRRPANNSGHASVRVGGGERVLVVGGDGSQGNVASALAAAGMYVDQVPEGPTALDRLMAYRVVVLEQVPAHVMSVRAMETLAHWVEHLGGGLVMTGGRRSFGSGGWHRSPIETILPVSMELRDEHRKLSLALAMCLDRSGSMAAPVQGGKTKMDLANAGAAAAVDLLSVSDQVAVIAVDSAPHMVVPLTSLEDPDAVTSQIRRIESMGGGIYVYEALVAGGRELLQSDRGTRHLVLFADAADSEVPGDYQRLLEDYRAVGITVSVIGLGSKRDSDAKLLEDIALLGGGRAIFSDRPQDLPRLFAQETVVVARSAWIDGPAPAQPTVQLASTLGAQPVLSAAWPDVAGYNLAYAKPRADVLAQGFGDPVGPLVSTWRIGSGRSAALTLDLDDPKAPELLQWPGYAPLVASVVRWCANVEEHPLGMLTAERHGRQVDLRLELDPQRREQWPNELTTLDLLSDRGDSKQIAVRALSDGIYYAQFDLTDQAAWLPSIAVPSKTVPSTTDGSSGAVLSTAIVGPVQQLLYPPEAEPRMQTTPGPEVLADLSALTGGQVRSDLLDVYDNPPSPGDPLLLAPWLMVAALCLLVFEIAVRRFDWQIRRKAQRSPPTNQVELQQPVDSPAKATQSGSSVIQDNSRGEPTQGLHEALRQLKRRG